jgi:transcriptional regulator with XRE-family HTH domain
MDIMTFAERLIRLRMERNLTQTSLALATNYSRRTVGSWENGHKMPTYDSIVVLAQYFNVSSDYLLGLTDDPTPANER